MMEDMTLGELIEKVCAKYPEDDDICQLAQRLIHEIGEIQIRLDELEQITGKSV